MPTELIHAAFKEFHEKVGFQNEKRAACFLWSLWRVVEDYHDVMEIVRDIELQPLAELIGSRDQLPDSHIFNEAEQLGELDDLVLYLIQQTLRVQFRVRKQLPIADPFGRASLPRLDGVLLRRRRDHWLCQRPSVPGAPRDFERHRHPRRLFFPDIRIIPDTIAGSLRLDVTLMERKVSLVGMNLAPRLFATPVTYDPDLKPVGSNVRFRLAHIKEGAAERGAELLNACLEACEDPGERPLALMWPELSVDEDVAIAFTRHLEDQKPEGRRRPLGRGPRVAIPGTFSVESEASLMGPSRGLPTPHAPNRAWLIDLDTGLQILSQDKIKHYGVEVDVSDLKSKKEKIGLVEANSPGNQICVAVSRNVAFCIMICKDFVDADVSLSRDLDVDYVFVPSMGNEKTYDAWKRQSNDLKRHWGGRSALALQAPPDTLTWRHTPGAGECATSTPEE